MTQRTHSPHKSKTDSRSESAPAQPQTAADNTLSGLVQRAQADPGSLTPGDVMALQRSVGNRATAGLLRPVVQMQGLRVGPANDRYEQEADRVARQVVSRVQTPPVQREGAVEEELQMKPLTPTVTPLQRKTFQKPVQREGGDEDELQMKAVASVASPVQRAVNHGVEGGEVEASVAQQIQRAGGGGKPLDEKVRGQMERGFGADFSAVRVHTGAQADTLNRSLNARAFTTGNDIFFKQGEYNPGSSAGKELLAHELTHTVQQGAAGVQREFQIIQREMNSNEMAISSIFAPIVSGFRDNDNDKTTEGIKRGLEAAIGLVGYQSTIIEILKALKVLLGERTKEAASQAKQNGLGTWTKGALGRAGRASEGYTDTDSPFMKKIYRARTARNLKMSTSAVRGFLQATSEFTTIQEAYNRLTPRIDAKAFASFTPKDALQMASVVAAGKLLGMSLNDRTVKPAFSLVRWIKSKKYDRDVADDLDNFSKDQDMRHLMNAKAMLNQGKVIEEDK